MFLIRTTLLIGLGVLVLPTDEAAQARVTGGAKTALTWSMTFCDRNGQTCAQGRELWAVFVKKAEFGAKMAFELIRERNQHIAGAPQPEPSALAPGTPAPMPAKHLATQPAGQDPARNRGTLRANDLEPAWRGKIAFNKPG